MIIVRLAGGLGNQMFQYAAGRHLAASTNTKLYLDTRHLLDRTPRERFFVFRDYDLDIFNIEENFTPNYIIPYLYNEKASFPHQLKFKLYHGLKKINVINEPHFHHSQIPYQPHAINYLRGYWQSWKYFQNNVDLIRRDFTFKESIGTQPRNMLAKIQAENSVCLNVRRTDMVANPNSREMSLQYFTKGIEYFLKELNDPHFFVFSDDLNWCKNNLKIDGKSTIVPKECAGPKYRDYFQLMISCNHFLIPNSTFGWWAAFLNTNHSKKVVAPKNWSQDKNTNTEDLIPKSWIRL